jgi:hypothetical protein
MQWIPVVFPMMAIAECEVIQAGADRYCEKMINPQLKLILRMRNSYPYWGILSCKSQNFAKLLSLSTIHFRKYGSLEK